MKIRSIFYAVISGLSIAAVAWLLVMLETGGSERSSIWRRLTMPGALSAAHAFLEQRCESCHVPSRGPVPETCVACHATNTPLLAMPTTVFHTVIGECAACHTEHRGRPVRPVVMRHAALLGLIEPATADGPRPQATIWPFFGTAFDNSEHRASAALNCLSCHSTQDRHRGAFGPSCAACHQLAQWTIPAFRHPSPRSTDCGQCHVPPPSHYMGHVTMMLRTMPSAGANRGVEQCFVCHRTSSWNDLLGAGWVDMH